MSLLLTTVIIVLASLFVISMFGAKNASISSAVRRFEDDEQMQALRPRSTGRGAERDPLVTSG